MTKIYCIEPEKAEGNITIAFLTYNAELLDREFRKFADTNKNEIVRYINNKCCHPEIRFRDGTRVIGFREIHDNCRGYKIDQILLCDDSRKIIYGKRYKEMKFLKDFCMNITCIPEEFQIMYLVTDEIK